MRQHHHAQRVHSFGPGYAPERHTQAAQGQQPQHQQDHTQEGVARLPLRHGVRQAAGLGENPRDGCAIQAKSGGTQPVQAKPVCNRIGRRLEHALDQCAIKTGKTSEHGAWHRRPEHLERPALAIKSTRIEMEMLPRIRPHASPMLHAPLAAVSLRGRRFGVHGLCRH
jgi:hypothetical protein